MPGPIPIRERTRLLGFPSRGRHVLVVGGGRTAASRVHALAQSELPITVVAPSLCDDLFDLLVEHRFRWVKGSVSEADLSGAWMVHVATADLAASRTVEAWVSVRRGMPQPT